MPIASGKGHDAAIAIHQRDAVLWGARLAAGEPVGSFPYDGYWLDIGRHDDYEQAIAEFDRLLPDLLPGD